MRQAKRNFRIRECLRRQIRPGYFVSQTKKRPKFSVVDKRALKNLDRVNFLNREKHFVIFFDFFKTMNLFETLRL